MPKINLLPVRATAKLEAARQELAVVLGGMVFALFALYLWHGITQSRIDDSAARNDALHADLSELEKKATQVDAFKSEASVLEKKLAIIDKLSRVRSGPAQVLDALSQVINDQPKVWLTQFTEHDGSLVLEGGAIDQEDVSAFHLALAKQARLFTQIRLTLVNVAQNADAEYLTWAMSCTPIYEAG